MLGITSRLVCDSQVGSKRIVNDRRLLAVFRHDFVELCPLRQRSSVQSAVLLLLACPELLLILEMVRDVKFHATCSFMALSATHGLRHYCHNGQGCHRHYVPGRAVWRNDDKLYFRCGAGVRGGRLTGALCQAREKRPQTEDAPEANTASRRTAIQYSSRQHV